MQTLHAESGQGLAIRLFAGVGPRIFSPSIGPAALEQSGRVSVCSQRWMRIEAEWR